VPAVVDAGEVDVLAVLDVPVAVDVPDVQDVADVPDGPMCPTATVLCGSACVSLQTSPSRCVARHPGVGQAAGAQDHARALHRRRLDALALRP